MPTVIREPISLMAGAAVPLALFLYGVSLCGALSAGAVRTSAELRLVVVVKNVAHPMIAFLLGTYLLGLTQSEVFALTVLSALPTAQNIFVYALRYNAGVRLARSTVMVTTALSVPAILAITALLT